MNQIIYKYIIERLCKRRYSNYVLTNIINTFNNYYSSDINNITQQKCMCLYKYVLIIKQLDLFIDIYNNILVKHDYFVYELSHTFCLIDDFGMYLIFKNLRHSPYYKRSGVDIYIANNLSLFIKFINEIKQNHLARPNDIYGFILLHMINDLNKDKNKIYKYILDNNDK